MDNRDEGEPVANHINGDIVAFAMEAGVPLEIDVGINRGVFVDMMARNGGFLLLDDNCKMSDRIAFAIYDVREVASLRKRIINRLCIGIWTAITWAAAISFIGVVIGLAASFKNETYPMVGVIFNNDVVMSIWLIPIWLAFISATAYIAVKSLASRICRESGDENYNADRMATDLKELWESRIR